MPNEEFERKMEFIVNRQAQFSSDMLRLEAAQTELREAQARTNEVVNRLAAVTLEGFQGVNTKIDALVDSHIRLQESQARTDESLKTLIAVVDRYFERRNGGTGESPG